MTVLGMLHQLHHSFLYNNAVMQAAVTSSLQCRNMVLSGGPGQVWHLSCAGPCWFALVCQSAHKNSCWETSFLTYRFILGPASSGWLLQLSWLSVKAEIHNSKVLLLCPLKTHFQILQTFTLHLYQSFLLILRIRKQHKCSLLKEILHRCVVGQNVVLLNVSTWTRHRNVHFRDQMHPTDNVYISQMDTINGDTLI